MFFDKKKIRRTRTRPTFQTELLESRAMFSATEMPAVDGCPVDDIGLDIPAYEKPYGQDDSASDWRQKWENAKDNMENLKEMAQSYMSKMSPEQIKELGNTVSNMGEEERNNILKNFSQQFFKNKT